jgi:hypothetical protein
MAAKLSRGVESPVAVHVVSRHRGGLAASIEAAGGTSVCIRHWSTLPAGAGIDTGDVVVLDLVDDPVEPARPHLVALTDRVVVIGAVGDAPVSGQWLTLRGGERIEFVYCDREARHSGYGPAIAALARHLGAPADEELACAVLRRAPELAPVSTLVQALCRNPWAIRRPVELAATAGLTRRSVANELNHIGFRRIEHFVTTVRSLMLEVLREEFGSRGRAALLRAGVDDSSNHRRQVIRAVRSTAAGKCLRLVLTLPVLIGALLAAPQDAQAARHRVSRHIVHAPPPVYRAMPRRA